MKLWMKRGSYPNDWRQMTLLGDLSGGILESDDDCPCPNYQVIFSGGFNPAQAIGCDTGQNYSKHMTPASWLLSGIFDANIMTPNCLRPGTSNYKPFTANLYLSGYFDIQGVGRLNYPSDIFGPEPEEEEYYDEELDEWYTVLTEPKGWPINFLYTPSGWFTMNAWPLMYIYDVYAMCVDDCRYNYCDEETGECSPDYQRCIENSCNFYKNQYRYDPTRVSNYSIAPYGCGGHGDDILVTDLTIYDRSWGYIHYADYIDLLNSAHCGENRDRCSDLTIDGYQFVLDKVQNTIPLTYNPFGKLVKNPIGVKEVIWHSVGNTFNATYWQFGEGGTCSQANGYCKVEVKEVYI